MSNSTIVNSGTKNVGGLLRSPYYNYEYTHDSSVVSETNKATTVMLFVVGTSMSCNAYSDIAAKCASGQPMVFVVVDNNPGNLVKLSGGKTAEAFNDIVAKITDRLGDIVTSDAAIFVGGHSAGGYSVIEALQVNDGKLSFQPAGYLGADPLGRGKGVPAKKIDVPTFAIGFTVETCAVTLSQAGLAAYNVTSDKNRVMMQVVNPKDPRNQITHCIFSSDGCTACPSHEAGAWVRQVIANFYHIFANSVVNGKKTSKADYESAVGDDYKSLVNVFYGDETATV